MSDEEKNNTSDKFELHLELGDWRNVAIVLIGFEILFGGVKLMFQVRGPELTQINFLL